MIWLALMDDLSHKFFVAHVHVGDRGQLKANVNRFSNDNVWDASPRHRLVVPKLVFLPLFRREFLFLILFLNLDANRLIGDQPPLTFWIVQRI
jgi:hypothetical protein